MPITGNPVSLYFHIPFCEKKCPYCHFYVIPPRIFHKKLLQEALFLEWSLQKAKLKGRRIVSIYFGGGTPSLFPEGVEMVLSWIQKESLDLASDLEITLEANPDSLDASKIAFFQKLGINRFSLGIQSFEQKELSFLGRSHSPLRAIEIIDTLVEKGVFNISVDLMYDIPLQSKHSFYRSLQNIKSLPITHLSLYNLTIEPHTAFYKYRDEIKKKLPSSKDSLFMLREAFTILKEDFSHYEISAFCKKNFFSKHNIGYWTGRDFLGFGPSASSFFEGIRTKNLPSILRYHKLLTQKKIPLEYKDILPNPERQRELFCLKLRMIEGVAKDSFPSLLGEKTFQKKLQSLSDKGLLLEEALSWRLTEKGLFFHDEIASELI